MSKTHFASYGTAIAFAYLAAWLAAGELDPSQQDQFDRYNKQPNVPVPGEMLLNSDAEPDLAASGFVALFNGLDLDDWAPRGGQSTFEVRDGCIVGICSPNSPSTYLCTKKSDYRDFIFTAEMKFDVDTNSGIMFRAKTEGEDNNTVVGPQMEMEPYAQDRDWSGGIYGQSCGGWFYPLWLKEHQTIRQAQRETGWNRLTIMAKGNIVKTWLNGVPAAHWQHDGYLEGYFGLQIHKGKQGQVLWRNLSIKELQ